MKLEIPEHLTKQETWQRILYIVLFYIAFGIARIVLSFTVVIQVLIVLFTGTTQDALKIFAKQLAKYIHQIIEYVTFNSDIQPFPFSDWPSDGNTGDTV